HIVFSTKERRPFLSDKAIRERMHIYLKGICDKQNCPSLKIGGGEKQEHNACRPGQTMDRTTLVKKLKQGSSIWGEEEFSSLPEFHWQKGYGAFSISPSHLPALKRYIENQEEHHRRESFQDEFRRLLKKYEIEYDERYVWD